MTKQEILSAIAEKIAGQSNQVDIGGALGPVLNAIVELIPDSPAGSGLVVEGTLDSVTAAFIPNSGQPSFEDAAEAFTSGQPVILKINQTTYYEYLGIAYYDESSSELFASYRDGYIVWSL